jgi:MFS family permease
VPPSLNPFRTLLLHRNFRLFWCGQTLSLIGTWMQSMAQGWLALELSNSAFHVGLVASASSFPILLFSLHAGVLADRTDKLRLVRICQTLLALEAALLWWFTWSGHITIGWLIALATVNGLIGAFEIPARQSLVIDLVGREDLPGAIALNSSGFNLARVIGPSIGAAIIAQFGIAWCFGVNALSYATVLVGLFMVRLPPWLPPTHRASPIEGIREGLRYMLDTPAVSALMRLVTVYSLLGVPYLVLMPVVARDQLGLGAGGYGLLLASVGVGGLAGALSLAAIGDRYPTSRLLTGASFSFAGLLVVFAFVRSPPIACMILLATGFAMIVNNALCNATLQHMVPDALRGRMMAAYSFVVVGLSQVVGSFIAGTLARLFSAPVAIGLGGAVLLLYSYLAFFKRPELKAV